MNDYQPKVGDRVMVGEHGPYQVGYVGPAHYVQIYVYDRLDVTRSVLPEWLTPAPEPEPDEPTAPGALVRDGEGRYWWRREGFTGIRWFSLNYGAVYKWADIPRPITVILADPAEVETLRAEVESSGREVKAAWDRARRFKIERDEFDRTIDRALNELTRIGGTVHRAVTILRGES